MACKTWRFHEKFQESLTIKTLILFRTFENNIPTFTRNIGILSMDEFSQADFCVSTLRLKTCYKYDSETNVNAEINAAAELPHTLCNVKCKLSWTWIERASTNKILNYVINTTHSAPQSTFSFSSASPSTYSSHKSTASSLRDGTERVTVSTSGNFYFTYFFQFYKKTSAENVEK